MKGKAKEDFEKWLKDVHLFDRTTDIDEKERVELCLNDYPGFYSGLLFSMQYGVYLDWFDSVGIKLIDDFDVNEKKFFFWYTTNVSRAKFLIYPFATLVTFFETRHEARTKSIEKACEIYNEKHKDN
jgi:hypothetical protein